MKKISLIVSVTLLLLSLDRVLYAQSAEETEEERSQRIINNLMVGANRAFTDSDFPAANDSLANLLSMDSQFAPAYFLMAKINVRKNDYDRAAVNIRRSIELDPENEKYAKELSNIIGLNYNEGNLEYRKGNYAKALEKYDTVLKFDPGYAGAYYMKGIIAGTKRNTNESITLLSMAINASPTMARAYYARGNAHLTNRNYDKAVQDFETAASLEPTLAKAWANIGVIELNRKNYDRVVEVTQKAIESDPKLARAYRDQGIAYSNKGNWSKAVDLQLKATSLNKRDSRAFFHLAEANNQLGNCQEANDAALTSTKLKSTNGGGWVELGLSFKCLDREAEAINSFEKAKKDSRWREVAVYNIDLIVNKDKYNLE